MEIRINLGIFDVLDRVTLSKNNLSYLKDTLSDYQSYCENIKKLDSELELRFLKQLKNDEIINNQRVEQENMDIIVTYSQLRQYSAIDMMTELHQQAKDFTHEDVKRIHSELLMGTRERMLNNSVYRTDVNHDTFVGSIMPDGSREVDYYPLYHYEIEEAMDRILKLFNHPSEEQILLNPFHIHALIALVQPFQDGNTRLARNFQHIKMWDATNKMFDEQFELPLLYMSQNYYLYRSTYRGLIKQLARENDSRSWNDWYTHNLNLINEQLYYQKNQLDHGRAFQKQRQPRVRTSIRTRWDSERSNL